MTDRPTEPHELLGRTYDAGRVVSVGLVIRDGPMLVSEESVEVNVRLRGPSGVLTTYRTLVNAGQEWEQLRHRVVAQLDNTLAGLPA